MNPLCSYWGRYFFVASLLAASSAASAEIIFEESFDDLPDWHSGLMENDLDGDGLPDRVQSVDSGHVLPTGWDYARQDPSWAPSTGHPDRRETIEILSENLDKAKGGQGKSFVQRRDSSPEPEYRWNSDGQLLKVFDNEYKSLYIEFWIKFDPDWTSTPSGDTSKIFRVGSWSKEGNVFRAFGGGEQGPLFLWDWKHDSYGVRNVHSMRGGPHGENYTMKSVEKGSHPRNSLNFTTDTIGVGRDSVPKLPDRVNGGFISDDLTQIVTHEQVYGNSEWTKISFFVSMNSEPDMPDGRLAQWINGVKVVDVNDIVWVSSLPDGTKKMVGWNFFSIGGNDYFKSYPDSERRQEWYAIDDLIVRTSIPEGLDGNTLAPPSPPGSVSVD